MYIISAVVENGQTKVAVCDKEYKILLKKEGTDKDLEKLCLEAINESGIKASDVDYIGVAADTSVADLEKNTGIKCIFSSVIGARALGEAYLAGDVPFAVMLKIDDSVECGIVIDRKIYLGARGQEVNVANMIIDFGGYECPTCGKRGCFGAYATGEGLKRIAAEAGVADAENLTHEKLFAMDTVEADKAKKLYVKYLASGITNIINLFQPNELVLEGAFTRAGKAITEPLMDIILREQYTHSMPDKCNVRFEGKEDTALVGVALLGR